MVLVQRKIKIIFRIESTRTLNQIRNYVNNTVFPEWDAALATAFSGYPHPAIASTKDVRVSQQHLPSNQWWVYPKYYIQTEVTAALEADARARYAVFIDDVRDRTRDLIASLTGTRVLTIYKDPADGGPTIITDVVNPA